MPQGEGRDGAEYKFDDDFYQKIQDVILEEPQGEDFGVCDDQHYYNAIMVVAGTTVAIGVRIRRPERTEVPGCSI